MIQGALTVDELIEKLQDLPGYLPVRIRRQLACVDEDGDSVDVELGLSDEADPVLDVEHIFDEVLL